MEVKEKSKKRELIKTIAIVFLTVLLLLTFFSGTIMNYSLPEVATQMASSGTINAKIRGSGTVAANESYEVILKQTREVRSVCVKEGDTVAEGDLLFVLGDIESQELKAAQEALEKARISYQEQVLNYSKEYATDDQNVKMLREDLQKAIKERDANLVTDEQVSFAKGDLASAESALSGIEFTLKELNALQTENEDYANAKAKVTELESKIKSLEAEVDGYQDELDKVEGGGDVSTQRKIQDAQTALSQAQTKWEGDWRAYRVAIAELMTAAGNPSWSFSGTTYRFSSADQITIEGYLQEAELNGAGKKPADSAAPAAENTSNYKSEWRTAFDALLADQQDVDAKSQALQRAIDDSNISSGTATQQRRAIQEKLDVAQGELSVAQRDLRTAQQELNVASSNNTQVKEQIRAYEAQQRQQEASITVLKANLTDLEAKQTAYKAAVATIEEKQRALETALTGDDIDKKLNNLNLQSLSMEIEKQQELVDKYTKDSVDAEIISPVSGVVSTINITAGKETTPDQAMAVIDVIDRGYTVKVSVTNDQAKQVKVGDAAEVTNYYWGNDISATLEQITADPASGGQKKLLVFRIKGDIEAGTNITLSVGQRSAEYSTVVPKSALREDANGKFVFIITSKSTPLGNRYTATRVDVQVMAEDDTSAAVSGLANNDYVITTASKPLSAGSQVRMVENP